MMLLQEKPLQLCAPPIVAHCIIHN